jgi:DNA polymerase-3 subunit gamma/tau
VARILAKALNCLTGGPTPHPCNACQVCREITAGSFLDVLEIDGASNRGIDEVRDLREKIKYLPAQGRFKIYIIDEVHMLTDPAFNALLKTVEEPPAHAVFILATTHPHKVPVTILSRCQRYDFRRIPTGMIQEQLAKLCRQEGWEIDPEGLALIARAAEGSLRDAQGFLDQVVTFGGHKVTSPEIARILGVTERGALLGALAAILNRQAPALLEIIEELYTQGQDLKRFYQDLELYLRHLLLAALHPDARHLVAVADPEWEELCRLSRDVTPAHLHNLMSVLIQGEEDLRRVPQPRLALEVLLLKLIHLEPVLPLSQWLSRLESLEQRLEAGPCVASEAPVRLEMPERETEISMEPPEAPVAIADTVSLGGLEARWQEFLRFVLGKKEGPLYGKLSQCRLLGLGDHKVRLAPGRTWNSVSQRHEARLQELVREFFGPQYAIEIDKVETPKARKTLTTAAEKTLELADLKQQALEVFGGQWLSSAGTKEDKD